MALLPIATLSSPSGDMQFFTIDALRVWADLEMAKRPSQPPPPVDLASGPRMHCHGGSHAELLDGFSIQQWASYSKRKSNIASSVCKENGELKAKLANQVFEVPESSGQPHGAKPDNCDVIFVNDPWRASAPTVATEVGSTASTFDDKLRDPWTNWHGSAVAKNTGSCDAVGDQVSVSGSPEVKAATLAEISALFDGFNASMAESMAESTRNFRAKVDLGASSSTKIEAKSSTVDSSQAGAECMTDSWEADAEEKGLIVKPVPRHITEKLLDPLPSHSGEEQTHR